MPFGYSLRCSIYSILLGICSSIWLSIELNILSTFLHVWSLNKNLTSNWIDLLPCQQSAKADFVCVAPDFNLSERGKRSNTQPKDGANAQQYAVYATPETTSDQNLGF
jgi:hypothetical protein